MSLIDELRTVVKDHLLSVDLTIYYEQIERKMRDVAKHGIESVHIIILDECDTYKLNKHTGNYIYFIVDDAPIDFIRQRLLIHYKKLDFTVFTVNPNEIVVSWKR